MPPCTAQPLDYVFCSLDNVETVCTVNNINVPASQEHITKALEESSHAPPFAETQNIEAPSPTSSNGEVSGQEICRETCCNGLPTTFDESLRYQLPPIQDHIEMEAFYASLDAQTHVLSCSYDKASATALSEEAREALTIVQDFISNDDASVLLHPQRCSVMKASLDYPSNLFAKDGISGEVETLISEASWLFTHCRRDYTEASMEIQSTASELQRADELEAGLEDNKNQFREVVALENELLQKLEWMEKNKEKLEEQINAIKANLSACKLEKDMAVQRKRDIFKEGKTHKAQIDELRDKVPCLRHEQGLAKNIEAQFTVKWSKLGEKFKTIVIE